MTSPLQVVTEANLAKILRIAQHQIRTNKFSFSGLRSPKNQIGTSSEIASYRSYSPGDDVKNIDWRQSARSMEPQIREYHKLHSAEWYVCLDISSSMAQPTREKWERSIQLTAAIVYLLLGLNNKTGLVIFDEKVKFATKPQDNNLHYHNIYKYLARLKPPPPGKSTNLLSCLSFVGKGHPLFIISDLYIENNEKMLLLLKQNRSNVHIIQLTQNVIKFHKSNGNIRIIDCESGQSMIMENNPENIAKSNIAHQDYNDDVHDFCHLNSINLTQVDSSKDWFSAILDHLEYNVK